MICKSKYYKDFSEAEIEIGYNSMIQELKVLPFNHDIKALFLDAWIDFKAGKFSYDGATFVKERYNHTLFEVVAFGHDRRNSLGHVGKEIDQELIDIMTVLGYDEKLIKKRKQLMKLTFINVYRRKFLQFLYPKKNFYKKELPTNIYKK